MGELEKLKQFLLWMSWP